MDKKYVSLKNVSNPAQSPYQIRTWMPPHYYKGDKFEEIKKCTGSKSTLNNAGGGSLKRNLFDKMHLNDAIERKCPASSKVTDCVRERQLPKTLKYHNIARENIIKLQNDMHQRGVRFQDKENKFELIKYDLIKFQSPSNIGQVKPSSPSPSLDIIYSPSKRLLELKRPKSGIFINATPLEDADQIRNEFNPRTLQLALENEHNIYDVIQVNGKHYVKVFDEFSASKPDNNYAKVLSNNFPCVIKETVGNTEDNFLEFDSDVESDSFVQFEKLLISNVEEEVESVQKKTNDENFSNQGIQLVIFAEFKCSGNSTKQSEFCPLQVAILVAAYGYNFHRPVETWNMSSLQQIEQIGKKIHENSLKKGFQNENPDFGIETQFNMGKTPISVNFGKLFYAGNLWGENFNVALALRKFFREKFSCIFVCRNVSLLIWKQCKTYYIFDANGRNRLSLKPDEKHGSAVLLSCENLKGVASLILNGSQLKPNWMFTIYEVSIGSYGTTNLSTEVVEESKTERNYAIMNKYFATIAGNTEFYITTQKSNPSMLISSFARIYSDIHPARFWTGNMLDQLWKYARVAFSKQCKSQKLKSFTIANLPKVHRLGSYRAEVRTEPFLYTGQVGPCKNFRQSQLAASVCALFTKYESALVEIGCITLSVWKDSTYFYMFSPFGNYTAEINSAEKEKKSIPVLQIHLNKRSLCHELHNIATSIEPAANFFIHGLAIFKLRAANHSRLKSEKTAYPLLFLDYPVQCNNTSTELNSLKHEYIRNGEVEMAYERCLSVLSVSPCKRTCSESDITKRIRKEKIRETKNPISSFTANKPHAAESKLNDWYDAHDVVDFVLEQFLEQFCGGKGSSKNQFLKKARKVLLKSDKSQLENLIGKVQRGEDFNNYYEEVQNTSYDGDIEILSNGEMMQEDSFELMPDGDSIINNSELLETAKLDGSFESISAFVATVIANKYNIKSWNNKLLDYIANSTQALQKSEEISKNFTRLLISSKVPDIEVENTVFRVSVEKTAFGPAEEFQQVLERELKKNRNLMLSLNSLSCAIFKRNSSYFLYFGFPCSVMGFRSNNCGFPCLIRSSDLGSIVRRIQANQKICTRNERGMIFSLHVTDISKDPRSIFPRSLSEEEFLLEKEKEILQKANERKEKKILFLTTELDKENQRIDIFYKQKGVDEEQAMQKYSTEEEYPLFGYDEHFVKKQMNHEGMSKFEPADTLCPDARDLLYSKAEVGYQYTSPDFHFKIQGTAALESRHVAAGINLIRSCHFASLFAIMYAVHRPLAKWDFRRVDMAIENGANLFRKTKETMTLVCRKIMDLIVDDIQYTLEVKQYGSLQKRDITALNQAIHKISQNRKYFLLQLENQTFAVHIDKYFHLFDPYRSLETITDPGNERKSTRLKSLNSVQDRNSASWIIFPSINDMFSYIKHRTTLSNGKYVFNLYVVNILGMKKVPKKDRMVNELRTTITAYDIPKTGDERLIELQSEKVSWIETFGGAIPWSPMCAVNLNGEKRGQPTTMWKHFSVEIHAKLYTLWGHIHPNSIAFGSNRGKQYQAINILSCCMAHVYPVEEWTPNIINNIVMYGDEYFTKSASSIVSKNYEIALEDFDTEFMMGKRCNFAIHLESVVYGLLYDTNSKNFNLSRALSFFFLDNRFGIIQCLHKSFSFGKTKTGYFLFDCQSEGEPLFAANQGSAYVLFAKTLDILLFCMVMTLRVPYYNIEFVLYAVAPALKNTPESDKELINRKPNSQTNEFRKSTSKQADETALEEEMSAQEADPE